jgi:hypothetical protein
VSEPPHAPSNPAIDTDGRLTADIHCVQCGYNLRTQLAVSRCPECSTPIDFSFRGYFLSYAPPAWLQRVRRGVGLLILNALVGIVAILALIAATMWYVMSTGGFTPRPQPMVPPTPIAVAGGIFFALLAILFLIAVFMLTTRNPEDPPEFTRDRSRVWLRYLLILAIALTPIGWFFTAAAQTQSELAMAGLALQSTFSQVIGIAVLALLVGYLSLLMQRVPRPGLARAARIIFWGVAISGIVMALAQAPYVIAAQRYNAQLAAIAATTATQQATQPATAPATAPTTAPAPLGAPRVPPLNMLTLGFVNGCGSCVLLGFLLAEFILLFRVRGALREVLRAVAAHGTGGVRAGADGHVHPG